MYYMNSSKERVEHMREMFADPDLELTPKEALLHTALRVRYEMVAHKQSKLARKRLALAERINADIETFGLRKELKNL